MTLFVRRIILLANNEFLMDQYATKTDIQEVKEIMDRRFGEVIDVMKGYAEVMDKRTYALETRMDTRFDTLDSKVDNNSSKIASLERDMFHVKDSVTNIEDTMVTREYLDKKLVQYQKKNSVPPVALLGLNS